MDRILVNNPGFRDWSSGLPLTDRELQQFIDSAILSAVKYLVDNPSIDRSFSTIGTCNNKVIVECYKYGDELTIYVNICPNRKQLDIHNVDFKNFEYK